MATVVILSFDAQYDVDRARAKYLPADRIDLLFIAEAPPADPARFFYFDQVHQHDWLYLSLMRVLFLDARGLTARRLREGKLDYLERFRDQAYYLIDASDHPMPANATPGVKGAQLSASLDKLVCKLSGLATANTRVVLISGSVYEVCCARIKAEGFNVINTEMIDFPSSGRQQHFTRKLRRDLHTSDELLQSTIQGLNASLEFFSSGEERKRARERWIVEHFLGGLGVKFDPSHIVQPEQDPPDAYFGGATFEVKEIQQAGRRRGDEYREALTRAKAAISYAELSEGFEPQSLPIREAYRLLMDQTHELSRRKYVNAADRHRLDLLFYLNLDMALAWDIEDGARPDIAPLIAEGWRSVSFLHGASTVCVLYANDSAPDFLKCVEGRLIMRDLPE